MLRKFVTQSGRDYVAKWYDGLSDDGQEKCDTKLRYLAGCTQNWRVYDEAVGFKYIASGPGKGLGEIKVKIDRVRYRLIGFAGPYSGDFTVLLVTNKKSWTLRDGIWKTATDRRKLVEKNKDLAHEWDI